MMAAPIETASDTGALQGVNPNSRRSVANKFPHKL